MEAEVISAHEGFLMAVAQGQTGRIFVHSSVCDFVVRDCKTGDWLNVDDVRQTERGLRAGSATWLSRPAVVGEPFTGTVMAVNYDRCFAFIRPDGATGTEDLFAHHADFLDFRHGASASFNGLSRGDRVTGQHRPSPRGPRAFEIAATNPR